jgi:predicted 3-demethylubiquinone-9 3-methyltransferase (glyoxalase superfamily)
MSKTAICLWFDKQGEEAARFYVQTYRQMGREAAIGVITRYPPNMPGPEGGVMTVTFTLDGVDFMALNGGPHYTHSAAASIMVKCADQAEIDGFWDKLVEGGAPVQCGWLTDRFGLSWQIVPKLFDQIMGVGDGAAEERWMKAMMPMVKLDVAALERAVAG